MQSRVRMHFRFGVRRANEFASWVGVQTQMLYLRRLHPTHPFLEFPGKVELFLQSCLE